MAACGVSPSETGPAPGYERVTMWCGAYHDQPILGPDEYRCDGCGKGFPLEMVTEQGRTDHIQRACVHCLRDGTVQRCDGCRMFLPKPFQLFADINRQWYGDKVFCVACKPLIPFEFRIQGSPQGPIQILMPRESVLTGVFYDKVAHILGIAPNRVYIPSLPLGMMMCLDEYYEPQSRKFDVTVL